jgi:divalent metal cation (Fe/Co/Zn/Cd) transporter
MHLSANQILVNAHVKFKSGLTLEEVEDIIDEIEGVIVKEVPEIFKIFIETHQKPAVGSLQGNRDGNTGHDVKASKKTVIRQSKSKTEDLS